MKTMHLGNPAVGSNNRFWNDGDIPVRKKQPKGRRVRMIYCSLCGELCVAADAHLHQGKHIGDECCWDDRLHGSE